MAAETSTWQSLGKAKLSSINNSIPRKWRLSSIPTTEQQRDVTGPFIHTCGLSEKEIEITETDAVGIVEKTTTGKWSAEEVTVAFCHRASLAHQLTNCLHETFFDAAIEDSKNLDQYYAKNKVPVGPLHGLPVSLKDQFHVKGVETTMGYVGWIGTFMGKRGTGKEKVFESEMVKELRGLGAVLYCKTSVPHTLMAGETVNNIIGYTTNPKNRNLSCGGSSGGEGALIGLKGSPVGFGYASCILICRLRLLLNSVRTLAGAYVSPQVLTGCMAFALPQGDYHMKASQTVWMGKTPYYLLSALFLILRVL